MLEINSHIRTARKQTALKIPAIRPARSSRGFVLEKEKSAIVLVPEISLTPQMLDRFIARFGTEKIAVLHSKLSIGERHDE